METSFDDKFSQCIQNLDNVDKPDYSKDETNLYADFVELLAVFSKGDGVAHGDVLDRFFGEPDENNSSETNDDNESFIDKIFAIIEERSFLYAYLYPFDFGSEQTIRLKEDLTISQKIYIFLLISSSLDIFNSFNARTYRLNIFSNLLKNKVFIILG